MPTLDRTAAGALALVDAYQPGRSSIFSAPERTVLAVGNQLGKDFATDQGDLVGRVNSLFSRSEIDTVLAAIPFAPDQPAALVLPESRRVLTGRRGPIRAVVERTPAAEP